MKELLISILDSLPTAAQWLINLLLNLLPSAAIIYGWIKREVIKKVFGGFWVRLKSFFIEPINKHIAAIANQKITKRVDEIKEEIFGFRKVEELKHQQEKEILKINHENKIKEQEHQHELAVQRDVDKDLRNAALLSAKGEIAPEKYQSYKAESRNIRYEQAKIIISAETGIDSNLGFSDYETLIQTAEKLLKCEEKTRLLLKKAVEALNKDKDSVSLSTIKLIDSFSDKDVEKISELFRYIWLTTVIYFDKINEFLKEKGLCQPRTDNIDYLGKIFSNQRGAITEKVHPINLTAIEIEGLLFWKETLSQITSNNAPFNEDSLRSFLSSQSNKQEMTAFRESCKTTLLPGKSIQIQTPKWPKDKDDKISIKVEAFVALTKEGQEIYDLLKSEIAPMPDDYFGKVKDFLENKYKNFELEVTKA